MRMLFIYGESPSFSIRLVSKLLMSDAHSYSNHILKQGTVMTVRCFSVNLQYVISTPTKEKAYNFRNSIYRPTFILHLKLSFI